LSSSQRLYLNFAVFLGVRTSFLITGHEHVFFFKLCLFIYLLLTESPIHYFSCRAVRYNPFHKTNNLHIRLHVHDISPLHNWIVGVDW